MFPWSNFNLESDKNIYTYNVTNQRSALYL